jgi:hypothetical protein
MLKRISKKLDVSKRKVSKKWQSYRTQKTKILGRKRLAPEFKKGLIEDLRFETRKKISNTWSDYRDFRVSITGKSDFNLFRTIEHNESTQKFYKARKGLSVEKYNSKIQNLLQDKKVLGVLAVMKVKDIETGRIHYVSDFITKGLLKRLDKKGKSIYEHVAEHKPNVKSDVEFEEIGLYMRVVYAKA